MIVDTSAILFRELDAEHYAKAMALAPSRRMSVANLVEATIVLERRGGASRYELDAFLEEFGGDLARAITRPG